MKAKKTLLFILSNPAPFIGYLLACWVLFSASITMSDDPFVHGTLPDAAEAAKGSFENLPWSIWQLVTALSIITEEIVSDFLFGCMPLAIPIALIFAYREARNSLKGIATEQQMWMPWYDRQQVVKAQASTYEIPPLSEHIPGGSYFIFARKTLRFMLRHPTLPTGHFVCWFFVFTLLALPIPFDTSDFMRSLPEIVIPSAIFTFILSYRETRENLKWMAIERHIWTKWYYKQIKRIDQGNPFDEPPSWENVRNYTYSGEIRETLSFMVRNPRPFIVHLMCWIFAIALLFFATLSSYKYPDDIFELIDLIGQFGQLLPWIAIIIFIISYREARGNLKGIAQTQQVWMQWYHRQQETIRQGDTFEEPPSSENTQSDSYFRRAQKAVLLMLLNPMRLMIHFLSWVAIAILWLGEVGSSMPFLLLIILVLISSYQEARGTVKGAAKEGVTWTKWWQRQTEAKAQGYTLDEVPPAINTG